MSQSGHSPQAGPSERGLSPVVGTVVLVAIVVLLATLVGAFAMGVGVPSSEPTTAVVELSYDDANDQLVVHHRSGEALADGTLVVRNESGVLARYTPTEFGVGETIEQNVSTATLRNSERVTVVWNPEGASTSGTVLVSTSTDTFGDFSANAAAHRGEVIYALNPSANVQTTHAVSVGVDSNMSGLDGVLVTYDQSDGSSVTIADIQGLGADTDGDGDIDRSLRDEVSSVDTLDSGHTLRIDVDQSATEYSPRANHTIIVKYANMTNPSDGSYSVEIRLDYQTGGDPVATGTLEIDD
ncbi:type IV pilin [Halospeciosus flavus]|uniref:Type IV pilin n=1 Tax=Halospeciosus flavus TaxID=3032283 RepID=A0ABD5Z0S5_9EURY|nr:type IV pilin [Halospeciosus flavus]